MTVDTLALEQGPPPLAKKAPRASAPVAVIALILAVLPLALLVVPVPGAGFLAAAVIAVAIVLAIVSVDRAVRSRGSRGLAVAALVVAVVTGVASSVAGVATAGPAVAEAVRAADDRQVPDSGQLEPGDFVGETALISGQWVVDELLHQCGASYLHAVEAGDGAAGMVFMVGERPVSVEGYDFTITVENTGPTWNGSVRGDAPDGGAALTAASGNPLDCPDIEIDALSGARVGSGGSSDSGAGADGADSADGVDAPAAPEGEVYVSDLEVGMCVNDADLSETFLTMPLVDCAEPHDSEVYAIVTLDDGPYPGDDEVFSLADAACLEAFEPYVGIEYDRSLYYFGYYWPNKTNWGAGDRDVICVLYDQEGPIQGSVRGSGR